MAIYKFQPNTKKLYFALTSDETGANLPNEIEEVKVKWKFIEKIDTINPLTNINDTTLKIIEEKGFHIPNWTIEYKNETTKKK